MSVYDDDAGFEMNWSTLCPVFVGWSEWKWHCVTMKQSRINRSLFLLSIFVRFPGSRSKCPSRKTVQGNYPLLSYLIMIKFCLHKDIIMIIFVLLGFQINRHLFPSWGQPTFIRPTPESILGRTLRSKYSPTVGTGISSCHYVTPLHWNIIVNIIVSLWK